MNHDQQMKYEAALINDVLHARQHVADSRKQHTLAELIARARAQKDLPNIVDVLAKNPLTIFRYLSLSLLTSPSMVYGISAEEPDSPDRTPQVLNGWYIERDQEEPRESSPAHTFLQSLEHEPKIAGGVVVDPWQIWEAKANGYGNVELVVGAQVTPDLTNLIRVCEEVGVGWILKAHHRMEIHEAMAAVDDAFARQPIMISLALDMDGKALEPSHVATIMQEIPLPNEGHYIPYMRAGKGFQGNEEPGQHPVIRTYKEMGIRALIPVTSDLRRKLHLR